MKCQMHAEARYKSGDTLRARALGSLLRAIALASVMLGPVQPAARADWWVPVASDGLGSPDRLRKPTALAIYGDAVFVAVPEGDLFTRVFRASIRDDTRWMDATPPWGEYPGEPTDMLVWDNSLWVSTSQGKLWRYDGASGWRDESPAWAAADKAILALGTVHALSGGPRLVAAASGVAIWIRGAGRDWTEIDVPPDLRDSDLANAAIGSFGRYLYLGVGGSTEGSTVCRVWRFRLIGKRYNRWWPLTLNGFGNPDLTWVNQMVEFGDWLYIGTAGHDGAGVFRTRGTAYEDVTPCDLYEGCAVNTAVPIRYGSLAVSAGQLFTGTRTSMRMPTDVLARLPDGTWRFSNEPGFGNDDNDVTSCLAAGGSALYAATVNPISGFEIWRRNGNLVEMLVPIGNWRDRIVSRRNGFLSCLSQPRCPDWALALEPIAELSLILDTLQDYSDEEHKTILWARERMAYAKGVMDQAKSLADQADKLKNKKKAKKLREQAIEFAKGSMDLAVDVCLQLGA